MFRNKLMSTILKFKKFPKNYFFCKRTFIFYFKNLKTIITHKGMLFVKLQVKPNFHKNRIGEFVFNRKFFKRPARLKIRKRKC